MKTDEGSGRFLNTRLIAGALLAGASLGIQILAPLVWPKLDRTIGMNLVALCALAFLIGVALLWLGQKPQKAAIARRWKIVGIGQGWIEARVRSNSGDQVVVSWNEGSGGDKISVWVTFRKRSKPRQSESVEMIIDVDGTSFEWDLPDTGDAQFALNGETWRDVGAIKTMLAVMRQGTTLLVSVPALSLCAQFTLNDAFDVLQGAASLGEATEGTTA
jgi:hypothetical protein